MANITRKRTGELLRKLFQILEPHPEGLQAGAALSQLADSVELTEYESGRYESSGGRRFEKIVRFATVDCVKAGWLVKQKGTWSLTAEGIQAYNSIGDPEKFYRQAVKLYNEWKALQKGKISDLAEDASETEVAIETSAGITLEEAEEQALDEIKNYIAVMPPYEFQELVADLLKAMSYHVSWTAPPGKDGGVDIIAYTDPLGTQPPRIKVQVKRQKSSVDLPGLKSFLANVNEGDVGIYVCTGGFTKDAAEHARNQERRKLTLIDVEQLVELWIDAHAKLGDTARKRLPLTPVYFLSSDD